MKFFRKDLCERLQVMGCISQSGFYWVFVDWIDGKEWVAIPSFYKYHNYALSGYDYDIWAGLFDHRQLLEKFNPTKVMPAFTESDFLGTSDTARENCRKVFGTECRNPKYCKDAGVSCDGDWKERRREMLDSQDGEAYIEKSLECKL